MMKRSIFVLFSALWLLNAGLYATIWQWSVEVKGVVSSETGKNPRAFLWIPPGCKQVRAVVMGKHNMTEETIFENPIFRNAMADLDFAELWITPGIDLNWDVSKGTQAVFEQMMENLAETSGYSELKYAPIVPIGHSAMATYPWNFAAWNPERTLAVLSVHGDAPRTNRTGYGGPNLDWGDRTIDGIPGLMMEGEFEWWEDRVDPALAFRMKYPRSAVSFLCDAGHGHFDVSEDLIRYMVLFLKKAAQHRLPKVMPLDRPACLIPVDPQQGWLADRWRGDSARAQAAPYAEYHGDRKDAFWYFDCEMVRETEKRYASTRGRKEQYIGVMQNGRLLPFVQNSHARIVAPFQPDEDGLTFHLKAVFTDEPRLSASDAHAKAPLPISRICGPVERVNDTTFTVRFYCMGMDNPRRTNDIWLWAFSEGNSRYKSSVQQLNVRIPYRHTEGKVQQITFPAPDNVRLNTRFMALTATSDSELPVSYYVKEGPAEVKGDKLVFTKIPPRAKFPVKVTVVAWQYGRATAPQVQTAEPVERSFYIEKD